MLIAFLFFVILLLIAAVVVMWVTLYRLGQVVLTLENQVEESLDMLDSSYRVIAAVLDTPVASDEPFIKQVLSSVQNARQAVLLVASKIAIFSDEDEKD